MERVLESPPPPAVQTPSKKEEVRLLFPGETTWEWWSLPSRGISIFKSSTTPEEASLKSGPGYRAALPLRHLLVLPLWLATNDTTLLRDMVRLQLERQGISGSGHETSFTYQVSRETNHRTLAIVSVLAENYPREFCFPKIREYRPATDYWSLPSNQLIVWKELGALVYAFTSGTDLIHVQSSVAGEVHPSFIQEAHCARLLLENEGSLTLLLGLTAFGNFSRAELEILGTLGLPLQVLERPRPVSPKTKRNLLPAQVSSSQKNRRETLRTRRFLTIAAAVYLLLVAGIAGHLAWLQHQKNSLNQILAAHRPEITAIRSTAVRWKALEPALLPETYPLEMLYRCSRPLPEQGVRLLTYEQEGSRINLTGEAKNAPAAFQYVEAMKKSSDLEAYSWTMPAPQLLSNDSARFVIEGRRLDALP